LFLIANKNIYIKVIVVASIYINIFKELRDTNTIILLINSINSLYIDRNLNNY